MKKGKGMGVQVRTFKDFVDFPCPSCGSSILTQKDYDITVAMISSGKVTLSGEKR